MTPRLWGLLLIMALAMQQPAMAGRLMLHHGDSDEVGAAMSGHMHHAARQGNALQSSHAPDCSKADASCGACCVAVDLCSSFIAAAIPSLRPEPVSIWFVQPDLAAALDPPRS